MFINLKQGFNSVSEFKKLDYDNDVNFLMGGGGVSNRLSLQAILAYDSLTLEKKRKKFIERLLELSYQQILEQIQKAQQQICDAINRMDDIINRADEHIAVIHEVLQDMTKRHNELDDTIEARYFERNPDGTYKIIAIANTIAAYEQHTSEKVPDDISPEMLILILQAQLDFEKNTIVPVLENELLRLNEFRDGVQEQKETLEEENQRINDAIAAIDANTSLSDEERRLKKVEILKEASETALDAQMAAHSAEQGFVKLLEEIRDKKWNTNEVFYDNHFEEDAELKQLALGELQNIKPLLPTTP